MFAVGILAVISWQDIGVFILIATAVTGIGAVGAARNWRSNSEAGQAAVARLRADFIEEQAKQKAIRHELRAELAAAKYALEELRKIRDPTEVLQSILLRLAESSDVTVAAVAELLEKADQRAALRDATIVATQRELLEQLRRLADRIVGEVADVVQAKVDELNPDLPSPDLKE